MNKNPKFEILNLKQITNSKSQMFKKLEFKTLDIVSSFVLSASNLNKDMRKKLTKISVWLILATIVAGLFSTIMPKIAQAFDTNRPASDGNYTTWTPSTAGSHFPMVIDSSDTTYVSTTTDTNKDSYGLTSGQLPLGANVTSIKVWARAKRNHASKSASFSIFYRTGGSDTFGSSQSMTNTWTDYSESWSGLSWTDNDIDNLEIGVRLDAHQNGTNPAISEMWIEVTYYAVSLLATDKSDYPALGETITVDSTVKNGSSAEISGSTADYVIFIDGNGDHQPTAGETYMTNACASSGSWSSGNYTRQWSLPNVAVDNTQSDQWTCSNSNFPQNTTYHIWLRWYSGATTYDTNYVTFTSVPTLGEILLIIFIIIVILLVSRIIILFEKKRYWLFYYMGATFTTTISLILILRHFGIDQLLVKAASFHVYLVADRLLNLPLELLSNGRFQLFLPDGGSSILKLGIECSAIIESSLLVSLLIFLPFFSLRQRILRAFLGLVSTYVINLGRLLIIVLITHRFGPDYIFVAHAFVGRFFFFIAEILLYWWLFTKPMVRSVGDSIAKNKPLAVIARSGQALRWRNTYLQAAASIVLASILAITFGISNDWQKAFISQKTDETKPAILGKYSHTLEDIFIQNLASGQSATYNFSFVQLKSLNLQIIEAGEPLMVEVYLSNKFQNRTYVKPDQLRSTNSLFDKSLTVLPNDVLKIIIKNTGTNPSNYYLQVVE